MSRLRLCPSCNTVQKDMFQYKELNTCSHVYLRQIAIAPPLTAPYDGPYKVISRSGRIMKIFIKGKVATISIDRVKPAHWSPDQSNDVERKTVKKTTNFKTAGIIRGTGKEPKGSSSKITPRPVRQGFELHTCAKSFRHEPLVRVPRSLHSPQRLEHKRLNNMSHI